MRISRLLVRMRSLAFVFAFAAALAGDAGASATAERLPRAEARKLKSPIADSATAVREGRKTYLRLCQYCHGADGKAQANPDSEAPSLRNPDEWRYGSTDGELFVSIRDGAGHEMPAFGEKLNEKQIWQLTHYVRSIGPKEKKNGE